MYICLSWTWFRVELVPRVDNGRNDILVVSSSLVHVSRWRRQVFVVQERHDKSLEVSRCSCGSTCMVRDQTRIFIMGEVLPFHYSTRLHYCGTVVAYVSCIHYICWERYLRRYQWVWWRRGLFRVAECSKRHRATCAVVRWTLPGG
jgi:hypothetical protein